MNRHQRRALRTQTKTLSRAMQLAQAMSVTKGLPGSLSDHERRVSDLVLADLGTCQWFHGGAGGLVSGQALVPGFHDPRGIGDAIPSRTEYVYISQDIEVAERYALKALDAGLGGAVYLVEPVGPVLVDPIELRAYMTLGWDILGHTVRTKAFCCSSATIIRQRDFDIEVARVDSQRIGALACTYLGAGR